MVDVVNFNGNNDLVIQSTTKDGVQIEEQKSFKDFVSPFSASYQAQIEDLQDTIEDKKRLNGFINKEVLELYFKKEKLENKKTNKEQQVAHLLKELNGKDITNKSSLFQQAFNCFIEGDIDTALSVLDEGKIPEEGNDNKKQKAEIRILKARLLTIKNKFDEAGKNYEKALNHFKDWESSLEAGNFFMFSQDYSKTENYYQISLKEATTNIERIRSLNCLGIIYNENNKSTEKDKCLNEALKLSVKLEETDSIDELASLGMLLNTIGNSLTQKQEFLRAEQFNLKALDIRRRITKVSSENYSYLIADTLNDLGILKMYQEEYTNARVFHIEALEIREKLAKSEPQTYLLKLAESQINIGALEKETNNLEIAKEYFIDALETFNKLPEAIQGIKKLFKAQTLLNLGIVQYKNEPDKAKKSLQDAMDIYNELVKTRPNQVYPFIAETYHTLGNYYVKTQDFIEAENSFNNALNIKQKFADLIPEKFEITLAKTHKRLGDLYNFDQLNNEKLFQKNISIAIELFEKYADKKREAKNLGEVATNILSEWKKKWLENFNKVIDETFDEYDEVFKALAINENFELEQDIIFAAGQLENLNPILPKKTTMVKGKVKIVKRGIVSKV